MDTNWCCELLEDTIGVFGTRRIHNCDHGSHYTSKQYIELLKRRQLKPSMDGKGIATDNVYIERFWRCIKQEKIYLNPPESGLELYQRIKE